MIKTQTHTFMQNQERSYLSDVRIWLVLTLFTILISTLILTIPLTSG